MLAVPGTAYGQSGSGSGSEESDPFKNDPFFSRPLSELLGESKKEKPEVKEDSTNLDDNSGFHHNSSSSYSNRRFMNRINLEGLDYGGLLESGPYASNPLYGLYPSLPMVHFNRVDGLFLGFRSERMQWYSYQDFFDFVDLNPRGMIGYSFAQEEWQYEAGLEKYFGFRDRVMIGAEFHKATNTDDYWRAGLSETSVTSFFAGFDYLDYYKQEGFGAYLLARSEQFFEGGVSYNYDQFSSLETSTDYAFFGSHGRYRDNPPIEIMNGSPVDTLTLSTLTFSGSFNPKKLILTRHFTFALTGTMEIGDSGIASSDYDYTKYMVEMQSYLNFEPGSVLKHRLMIGSITGDAPLMKEFQLGGMGSLRAAPYKALPAPGLGGNKMILSTTELQFGSTNWGYDYGWIDFDDFYISFFLDSGWAIDYTGTNEKVLDGFSEFDFTKFEQNGGVGLGTNFVRLEAAWDLNHTSRAPMIWIRLNPTF